LLKTYDLKLVALIIGTETITGYGEDGGVEIEPNSDIAEATPGADGEYTLSRTNDKGHTATITVRETSRGYRILRELQQAQDLELKVAGLTFTMMDPISGETVSDDQAAFLTQPTMAKNREAGEREFTLLLPNPIITPATLNL
jgi:5-hydroxyisourate hydrolase-like protein (transthyretin family)